MYFHIITSAFYLPQQKMLKFEGCYCRSWWCDDVSTWLGGTLGHIEGWSRFPFTFLQNVMASVTQKLPNLSFLLIFFFFFTFRFLRRIVCFTCIKHNVSFPCLMSNKYLINLFDSLDWNLNVKSVYIFLSKLCFWRLILSFSLPSETFNNFIHTRKKPARGIRHKKSC